MLVTTIRKGRRSAIRRAGFTLLEVLVVVAILVILASIATIATTRYIEDAKKTKAQLGCKAIADAIENFVNNPGNPTSIYPQQPTDLIQPFFGGPSLLRNGNADLIDPWNKQYSFQPSQRSDGTQYIIVSTTAQDGTQISQFGIGPNAQPKF
ncbi:MAG TPA: prepilin-type N-terminal cleavage/methylation domain-containing protein [Gemmata sp.]|nr:prepilin-type N-terminal cleavage/methylation domain-containing protein [Gemmata sp.]